MRWANGRERRLLTWGMRWRSPSLGRRPTFREAWTGVITEGIDVVGMLEIAVESIANRHVRDESCIFERDGDADSRGR